MASLATLPDAVRLGYSLPAGREAALLARASARIRRAAGQQVSSITSTLRVRVEDGAAILPGPPITAVTAVTRLAEDGGAAVTGWRWDGRERVHGINVSTSGSLYRCWPADVNITYTHGLITLPDELVELVCSVAVRLGGDSDAAGMETGIRSETETIDDYTHSVTYAVEALDAAASLLPGELSQLHALLGSPPGAYVVRPR